MQPASRQSSIRQLGLLLSGVTLLALFYSTGFAQGTNDPWFLDPAGKMGAITRSTSEAELIKRFGAKNVKQDEMQLGEGETQPATVLFANDPQRTISISWKDAVNHANPARIQIDGDKSLWHTLGNVTLGTSLKELEKLNGGPFQLAGFGWDYSGTVTSWENGKLDAEFGHRLVWLRLNPAENDAQQSAEYEAALGDKDFSSANPAMQKLNPRVYQIIWIFD